MVRDTSGHAPGPERGAPFPEEERLRDGTMREEIITMVVEALNQRGYPELTAGSVNRDPAHRAAFLDLLRDCRPLPVVLEVMADAENGRL